METVNKRSKALASLARETRVWLAVYLRQHTGRIEHVVGTAQSPSPVARI